MSYPFTEAKDLYGIVDMSDTMHIVFLIKDLLTGLWPLVSPGTGALYK